MPIYEYRCEKCGHEFDIIQKMSEDALTTCPVCSKASLIKLMSSSSFQLKGTGWYQTDFKTKPSEKPAKSEKPEKTDSKTGES